jgi:hypothetical protein
LINRPRCISAIRIDPEHIDALDQQITAFPDIDNIPLVTLFLLIQSYI